MPCAPIHGPTDGGGRRVGQVGKSAPRGLSPLLWASPGAGPRWWPSATCNGEKGPWVGAGELVNALQPVSEGPHAQRKTTRCRRGHTTRVEVRGQGLQQGPGTTTGGGKRPERVMDQVGHGLAVMGQNGIDKEVGDAQHRIIEAESPGQLQRVECFLIGLDDSTGAGMRTAGRRRWRRAPAWRSRAALPPQCQEQCTGVGRPWS